MKKLLLIICLLLTSAFSTQPLEERQAQQSLPKSHDQIWENLFKTKISYDKNNGNYSAAYTPEIKALVGKQITISGFMLPLESNEKFKHFILSKRTPTCQFCPPGDPNEIVDVWLEKETTWNESIIKVSGKFELMNDQQFGMFFKLSNAKIE